MLSKARNLSASSLSFETNVLPKIVGVVNVLKVEFTLRSWQRSSPDTSKLRIISNKSSGGSFVMPTDMTLNLNAGR